MKRWLPVLMVLPYRVSSPRRSDAGRSKATRACSSRSRRARAAETLPPAGPPIVTSTPTFPSRATSSWFFGDGATLLNGVLEEFGLASRVAPLDPLFAPPPSAHPAAFGLRVRRRLNPRVALEIGVEVRRVVHPHGRDLAGIETAFDSFASGLHRSLRERTVRVAPAVSRAEGVVHAPL